MSDQNNAHDTWSAPKDHCAVKMAKYTAIAVSSTLLILLFVRISIFLSVNFEFSVILVSGFGILFGYVIADFVTGTVHWFCDTFFSGESPIIGKILIQPFRDHHTYPLRITQHKFVEQDTSSFFLLLPVLAYLVLNVEFSIANKTVYFWSNAVVGLSTGLFLTNVFHRWAHEQKVPRLVGILQRSGLILQPVRHRRHHHRNHDHAFCVTSGWLNPVLDSVRFFPRLEALTRYFFKRQKTKDKRRTMTIDGRFT